jgi:mRNA-degrading endonuclease toxin of MazEF toxin-antitoxin module
LTPPPDRAPDERFRRSSMDELNNGLREVSWVNCEQILTVSKDRLEVCWGMLSSTVMAQIETAGKVALGLR